MRKKSKKTLCKPMFTKRFFTLSVFGRILPPQYISILLHIQTTQNRRS
jgi:hypothetical protein